MKLFYSEDYVASEFDFDTTRKAAQVADWVRARPDLDIDIVAPASVNARDLEIAHSHDYIEAVRTGEPRSLAESQGFTWGPKLWTSATASTGGVIEAAYAALADGVSGTLSSGLHHARRDCGVGFCTFNGLAVAAQTLLAEGAVSSVLIVDFDAHCGGGTESIVRGDPRITQIDVSTSEFDDYEATAQAMPIVVTDPARYLATTTGALAEASRADLILYNAGMDPYEGCDVGGLDGVHWDRLAAREATVFWWARETGMPIAFTLAGGYVGPHLDQERLTSLHGLTVTAAAHLDSLRQTA